MSRDILIITVNQKVLQFLTKHQDKEFVKEKLLGEQVQLPVPPTLRQMNYMPLGQQLAVEAPVSALSSQTEVQECSECLTNYLQGKITLTK